MTDKVQKIREEVERLRNLHQIKYQNLDTNDNMCLVECGKRNLCNELLSFIDSLQEEPVSEDLEEAAFDYAESCKYEGGDKLLCVEHFKAGAEWGKNQAMAEIHAQSMALAHGCLKEPVSVDLAAHKYADGENPTCLCEECLIKSFKTGAEWAERKNQKK